MITEWSSRVLPSKEDWDVGSLGKFSTLQVWHCRGIPPSTRCLRCLQLLQMQFIQGLLSRQKEKKRKAKSFAWCRPQMVMSDSISLLLRTYVSRVTVLRFSLHMPTCLWSPSSAISGNIQCQCTLKLQVSLSLHGEQKKLLEKNRNETSLETQDSIRKDNGSLRGPQLLTWSIGDFSNWDNSLRHSLSLSLSLWDVRTMEDMEGWWMLWDVDTGRCKFMALCSILEHCVDGIYADFLLNHGISLKPCLIYQGGRCSVM